MNILNKLYLLTALRKGGDLFPLSGNNTFSEISEEISHFIKSGYLKEENGIVLVTSKGEAYIEELRRNNDKILNQYILPQIQYRKPPIAKDFIYIPTNKEIESLR